MSNIIVDSVHGDIQLKPREIEVLNTASFQRLRRIKQLQMSQVTYPNATHTRFAHSVGTLGIMSRVVNLLEDELKDHADDLRLAALLHDVGHYPYSHLMEKLHDVILTEELCDDKPNGGKKQWGGDVIYPKHTELGREIVTQQQDLIDAIGDEERAGEIADIFTSSQTKGEQFTKLISSSLDLDRLDYALRDSQACGVPYGCVDLNYILNNLEIRGNGEVGVTEKALAAVEHVLLARFFLHRTVYFHKTTCAIEEACKQLLRRLRERQNNLGVPRDGTEIRNIVRGSRLLEFDDHFVDKIIRAASDDPDDDDVVKALARSILYRRPPKLVKEVIESDNSDDGGHLGAALKRNCKDKLPSLSKRHEMPLGLFLFCAPKPIMIGEAAAKFTAAQTQEMDNDDIETQARKDEERDIKVFEHASTEAKSVFDIKHSVISQLKDYCFRIYRLYVVSEDEDKVASIRKDVANWHDL